MSGHSADCDAPMRDWFIEHRGVLVPLAYAEYAEVFEEARDNPGRVLHLMDGYLARVTASAEGCDQ